MGKRLRSAGAVSPHRGEMGYCLLLLIFFALGVLGGSFLGDELHTADELALYLSAFLTHADKSASVSAVSAAGLYFRYPVFTALLALIPAGMVLLPFFMLFLGLELSFSAAAFFAVYGKSGIWAALCVLGLRTALVLPCCFILACGAPMLRRRKESGRRLLSLIAVLGAVLGAGAILEVLLVPRILHGVLSHMNF